MKYTLALCLILLSGCATPVPISVPFPQVFDEMMTGCVDLDRVPVTEKLSDVVIVVTKNYSHYHVCRLKIEAWQEWYRIQKEISDGVK